MHIGTAKTYKVFTRVWWRDAGPGEPGWPNGLVPYPGAPKRTLARGMTYTEAQAFAQEWNRTHKPGRFSRKAEFMEE